MTELTCCSHRLSSADGILMICKTDVSHTGAINTIEIRGDIIMLINSIWDFITSPNLAAASSDNSSP